MCEANVYLLENGQEKLLLEMVDRILPDDSGTLLIENIFGERIVLKAKIVDMSLVHHRIFIKETEVSSGNNHSYATWLEPMTAHGHFHPGEAVIVKIFHGRDMKDDAGYTFSRIGAFVCHDDKKRQLLIPDINHNRELNLGPEQDGLTQLYIKNEENDTVFYAKVILEVGHHHHQKLNPLGLPLEIIPTEYGHPHMGSEYGVMVLKNSKPFPGASIGVTYTDTAASDYPHILTADAEGKAKVFLTEPGNYLFVTASEGIVSAFTLVKNF